MSVILCHVEPRFALIAADTLLTNVDEDGSVSFQQATDKVTASRGAILAVSGQDRLARPARRVLAQEGALSASGIRDALTCVRQQTARTLHEESLETPSPTTEWRKVQSCVFATYTERTGPNGPLSCRIGVWNSHHRAQLTSVPPGTATENPTARHSEALAGILADWHRSAGITPDDLEVAVRTRTEAAREIVRRAAEAWEWSDKNCRIGVHVANPEELRLSIVLETGRELEWTLQEPVDRRRPKGTLEQAVRHYGWPRGNTWRLTPQAGDRGPSEQRPA